MFWSIVCLTVAALAAPTRVQAVMAECDGTYDSEVKSMEFRVENHEIPNRQFSMMCATFDLPDDPGYIITGFEPLVDNKEAIWKMYLVGCDSDDLEENSSAQMCDMMKMKMKKDQKSREAMMSCGTYMACYGHSSPGQCYGEDVGFPMGRNSTGVNSARKVKIIIEYVIHDIFSGSSQWDNSGFKIYYKPRWDDVHELATLITGQKILEIPPQKSEVKHIGRCGSDCTRKIVKQEAHIVAAIPMMEEKGKKIYVEQYRYGEKIADILVDEYYSTYSMSMHPINPPVVLKPGDEIKTTCVHQSLYSDRYTYGGMGYHDETCKNMLIYSPAGAISENYCMSVGPLDQCELMDGKDIMGCDWKSHTNMSSPTMRYMCDQIMSNCNLDGFCRPECYELMENMKYDPCTQGEAKKVVSYMMEMSPKGKEILGRLQSCKWKLMKDNMDPEKINQFCREKCHTPGGTTTSWNEGTTRRWHGGSTKKWHDGKDGHYDSAPKLAVTSAILVFSSFLFTFVI